MLSPEDLLTALDPQQQQVALQIGGPLCVRAGAGTGKTRAITYRIAYGVSTGQVSPTSVLAVTFTSRAAAEMRARLRELGVHGVQARTFHAAAMRQLGFFWNQAFSGSMPQVVPQKASLVASAAARLGIPVDRSGVRDLAAEIEWCKVSMIPIDRYVEAVTDTHRIVPAGLAAQDFQQIYGAYEDAKNERQVIDFEDVLSLTCGILSEHPSVLQQVRAQYRSFVVDEYQDVSALQQHLLDLWLGKRRDICVVGDVSQTIYSFTGASPRYLVDFPKKFPEGNVVELNRDYRSTPQIVAVANQVMARARGMSGVGPERGLEGAVRLVSQREGGPAVSFQRYDTDIQEAQGVAARIKSLHQAGTSLGSIAVLYRTNAQSEAFEKALGDLGIGVQVHGGARFFEREEVKRALVLLRQAARMRELVRSQIGPDETGPVGADPVETDTDGTGSKGIGIGGDDLVAIVEEVLTVAGWSPEAPKASGAAREKWENLDALAALARTQSGRGIGEFVAELQERASAQAAPEVNGVVLSTLHAAKGLEWDSVFIVGLSEGLLPISLAEEPSAIEEERRLLYVGITRARDTLQLSYALSRSGGRARARKLSRFLVPLWPKDTEQERPARKLTAKQQLRRDKEHFQRDADPKTLALFEELREWRLARAKEISKPAFTVMTDVTLRDIAIAQPKTLRQLGAVRGIGHNRLADYGAEVLRVIREHGE